MFLCLLDIVGSNILLTFVQNSSYSYQSKLSLTNTEKSLPSNQMQCIQNHFNPHHNKSENILLVRTVDSLLVETPIEVNSAQLEHISSQLFSVNPI